MFGLVGQVDKAEYKVEMIQFLKHVYLDKNVKDTNIVGTIIGLLSPHFSQ